MTYYIRNKKDGGCGACNKKIDAGCGCTTDGRKRRRSMKRSSRKSSKRRSRSTRRRRH
jgi:hypothetical protein